MLRNNSVLPTLFECNTEATLSQINFTYDAILNILSALDINKAYGHDDVSTTVMKLWDQSIITSLSIIFQNYIDTGNFPDISKNWA